MVMRAGIRRIENGVGMIGSLDDSKYQQWSEKEVLIWLKENLLNNGWVKMMQSIF